MFQAYVTMLLTIIQSKTKCLTYTDYSELDNPKAICVCYKVEMCRDTTADGIGLSFMLPQT